MFEMGKIENYYYHIITILVIPIEFSQSNYDNKTMKQHSERKKALLNSETYFISKENSKNMGKIEINEFLAQNIIRNLNIGYNKIVQQSPKSVR